MSLDFMNYSENDELRVRLAKAIAEIDSLRQKLDNWHEEFGTDNPELAKLEATNFGATEMVRVIADTESNGVIADPKAQEIRERLKEADSLRAQLGQKQDREHGGGRDTGHLMCGKRCTCECHKAGSDCGTCNITKAQIAELRAQLGEAQTKNEEIAQELVSAACELADYMGEDPEGALASLRADLSGYSKFMWAIARLLNSGSAKPEDVEAAVKERVTECDTLRSDNERLRSAVAWAYQLVGARWPNKEALDNLSDVLAGKAPRHEWPCVPPQSDDVERLREALRLIQWGAKDWMSNYCLRCRQGESMGHAPDCEVGAALAGEARNPIVDIANSQARTITSLAECLKRIAALSTGWKHGNEGVRLLRIQDLVRPFVDAALAGATSECRAEVQPEGEPAVSVADLRAFIERFNGLTIEERRAFVLDQRAKAQSEKGGAALPTMRVKALETLPVNAVPCRHGKHLIFVRRTGSVVAHYHEDGNRCQWSEQRYCECHLRERQVCDICQKVDGTEKDVERKAQSETGGAA